jgi:hypothetical protein
MEFLEGGGGVSVAYPIYTAIAQRKVAKYFTPGWFMSVADSRIRSNWLESDSPK